MVKSVRHHLTPPFRGVATTHLIRRGSPLIFFANQFWTVRNTAIQKPIAVIWKVINFITSTPQHAPIDPIRRLGAFNPIHRWIGGSWEHTALEAIIN